MWVFFCQWMGLEYAPLCYANDFNWHFLADLFLVLFFNVTQLCNFLILFDWFKHFCFLFFGCCVVCSVLFCFMMICFVFILWFVGFWSCLTRLSVFWFCLLFCFFIFILCCVLLSFIVICCLLFCFARLFYKLFNFIVVFLLLFSCCFLLCFGFCLFIPIIELYICYGMLEKENIRKRCLVMTVEYMNCWFIING